MDFHDDLIKISNALGYDKKLGFCHGFTLRWLEAVLLQQENIFYKRIEYILNEGAEKLSTEVNLAKAKKGINLTPEDRKNLEVLSFFDAIEIFQNPEVCSGMLGIEPNVHQNDIELVSALASSDQIQLLGALKKIYSQSFIFNKNKIEEYLEDLATVLDSIPNPTDAPYAFLLEDQTHTMGLSYYPKNGWGFLNINTYPVAYFSKKKTSLLARMIYQTYSTDSQKDVPFNISLVTTGSDARIPTLIKSLDKLKMEHDLSVSLPDELEVGLFLRYSAMFKHTSNIVHIAEQGVYLDDSDSYGDTAVHEAIYAGDVYSVFELGYWGADLTKTNKKGRTPAASAAKYGHAEIIALLGDFQIDLSLPASLGRSPAYYAAKFGKSLVLAELVKQGVDLNAPPLDLENRLDLVAAKFNHPAVIRELKKHNFDFNQLGINGYAPLHVAVINGSLEAFRTLLDEGAELNFPDENGETAIFFTIMSDRLDFIDELGRRGADFNRCNNYGNTPVMQACAVENVLVLKKLVIYGANLNYRTDDGDTAAHTVAESGCGIMISLLHEHHVALNEVNDAGETPATIAVIEDNIEVIIELGKAHVDFNKSLPKNMYSPLLFAVQNNSIEMVVELLKYGANPSSICFISTVNLLKLVSKQSSHYINFDGFIKQRLEQGHSLDGIPISPLEMAFLMENAELFQYLSNAVPKEVDSSFKSNIFSFYKKRTGDHLDEVPIYKKLLSS